MSLIADGLLVATCLTTAAYCFVLSRRLRRLSNTEEGIGQQIRQFNGALDETRSAVNEIRTSARGASERLMREIGQARKLSSRLSVQISQAESSTTGNAVAAHRTADNQNTHGAHGAASAAADRHRAPDADPRRDDRDLENAVIDPEEGDASGPADDRGPDRSEAERQLGFVPNEPSVAGGAGEDRVAPPGDPEASDDALIATAEAPSGGAARANHLLKVERMAL